MSVRLLTDHKVLYSFIKSIFLFMVCFKHFRLITSFQFPLNKNSFQCSKDTIITSRVIEWWLHSEDINTWKGILQVQMHPARLRRHSTQYNSDCSLFFRLQVHKIIQKKCDVNQKLCLRVTAVTIQQVIHTVRMKKG